MRGKSRTSSDRKIDRLEALPMFMRCSSGEIRRIARACDVVSVEAGRSLAEEGRSAAQVLIVMDGQAVVLTGGARTGTIGPGETFGELAALAGGTNHASLESVTSAEVAVIPSHEFRRLYESIPCLPRAIVDVIVRRAHGSEAVLR